VVSGPAVTPLEGAGCVKNERPTVSDLNELARRIDAEFSAAEVRLEKLSPQQVQDRGQREQRLERLGKVFEQLREIWKPRLELLAKKLGDSVQAKGRILPTTREATFELQSRLARIRFRLTAFTDRDVQKVILSYDLEIVPTLIRFDPHSEIEFPLGAVDDEAAARWIDDRIVEFVQTYATLVENDTSLKDYMVEDPIARVRFPKEAAAATVEWGGTKHYFLSDETRREFEGLHGIGSA
jgi:YHS domain-containing protein